MFTVVALTRGRYQLGRIDSIPVGEGRVFYIGQTAIAVFRCRSGEVYATQAVCPHEKGQLADGIIGGKTLVCPLHGYKFDLSTGEPVGHKCPSLFTYRVTLSADGDILVDLPR